MIRSRHDHHVIGLGIPRESGDDPSGWASQHGGIAYSPRERG